MSQALREKQMREAEEILGDRLQEIGFAKGLFFGQYLHERLLPYPDTQGDVRTNALVRDLKEFCAKEVDPVAIDRRCRPPSTPRFRSRSSAGSASWECSARACQNRAAGWRCRKPVTAGCSKCSAVTAAARRCS